MIALPEYCCLSLCAELSEHLGYEKGDPAGWDSGNRRNGYSTKTVIGDDGAIEIAVPRHRNSAFEPQILAKGQFPRRLPRRSCFDGSNNPLAQIL